MVDDRRGADAGVCVILTGITMWRQAILESTMEGPPAPQHTAEEDTDPSGWCFRAAHAPSPLSCFCSFLILSSFLTIALFSLSSLHPL